MRDEDVAGLKVQTAACSPPNRMRRLLVGAWVLYLLAVVVYSLLPGSVVTAQPAAGAKGHFLAFFGLAFLPATVFRRWRTVALTVFALIGLGAAIEVAQHLIPGRVSDAEDFVADVIGLLAGTLAGSALRVKGVQPS